MNLTNFLEISNLYLCRSLSIVGIDISSVIAEASNTSNSITKITISNIA